MDILDEMTKAEIISWVRRQFFFQRELPRKSDLLWMRYEAKTAEIQNRRAENIAFGKSLNLKKRDEYAKQFNATKNVDERMALVKKMEPYEKKLKKYLRESKAIMAADKAADKMYAQIEIERKKETETV